MAKNNPNVNSTTLDRQVYFPKLSDGVTEFTPERVITAATAFQIKIDLNGASQIQFFISEKAGVNNIAGFNLTVKYYEDGNNEITSSSETVVIPATTAGQNQYVAFAGSTQIQRACHAIVTGTLPHTLDYTVSLFCKSITVLAISGTITETNSGDIKTAVEAIQTATELIDDAIFTDNDTFATSASATMAISGLVEPTDTITAGNIAAIALDVYRRIKTANFDEINKSGRIIDIYPVWERHVTGETIASVTNAAAATYNYYIDVEGFNHFGLQGDITDAPTSIKVFGTMQNDGTAAASITAYEDLSTLFMGGAKTADFTASDSAGIFGPYKYIKIEVIAPLNADWILWGSRWFA